MQTYCLCWQGFLSMMNEIHAVGLQTLQFGTLAYLSHI